MSSTSSDRRVWGIGTPRTLRPHWMLAEQGLDYETRDIMTRTEAMDAPDFCALSQRKKIPLFEDRRVLESLEQSDFESLPSN